MLKNARGYINNRFFEKINIYPKEWQKNNTLIEKDIQEGNTNIYRLITCLPVKWEI